MNTARLKAELARIRSRRASPGERRPVSEDRAAFARSVGLEPDRWQERLLRSEAGRVLLNCCRQSGKSTTSALLALHEALAVPGSLTLVLAPALRQSQELFQKVSGFYRALGAEEAIPSDSERKLGVELANGSRIEALPGGERTVRGFSGVSLLIVDEASRVEDGLYYAVRPMLAVSGGRLVMMSTPFGKRGVFFEEWANGDGWERYEVPAPEVPRIPGSFLAEERRALPEWVYRQEYLCEFVETDDQVFSYDLVSRAITPDIEPLFGAGGAA